ncbi:MAG: hypothetical protein Q9192_002003 [Flavoplaca navasiana]
MTTSSRNSLSRPQMRTRIMAKAKPVHHHDTSRVGLFAAEFFNGGGSEKRERDDGIDKFLRRPVKTPASEDRMTIRLVRPASLWQHFSERRSVLRMLKLLGGVRSSSRVLMAVEMLRNYSSTSMAPLG